MKTERLGFAAARALLERLDADVRGVEGKCGVCVLVYAFVVLSDGEIALQCRDRPAGACGLFGGQVDFAVDVPAAAATGSRRVARAIPQFLWSALVRELFEEAGVRVDESNDAPADPPWVDVYRQWTTAGTWRQVSVVVPVALPLTRKQFVARVEKARDFGTETLGVVFSGDARDVESLARRDIPLHKPHVPLIAASMARANTSTH